jgi:hypothetical protein
MIITWLTGGLGNQMFQYAAGLALAEKRRTVLKLDAGWFREYAEYEAHNRYALSCFNITEQFATEEEVERVRGADLTRIERVSAGLARALHFYRHARRYGGGGHRHEAERFGFYPGFFDQPDNTYLHGMWQSERFFAPAADLLRLHFSFRYPAASAVDELSARIRNDGPSVAVHFRRGDYVRNPKFASEIGVLGADYYRRAVAAVRERAPGAKLYVFSDDIDAVEREFKPEGACTFIRVGPSVQSHEKIRLMSLCDHAIVSNSTFAWWGAWLNPKANKIVIAPDPWFVGQPEKSADMTPSSWLRLPAWN